MCVLESPYRLYHVQIRVILINTRIFRLKHYMFMRMWMMYLIRLNCEGTRTGKHENPMAVVFCPMPRATAAWTTNGVFMHYLLEVAM
jgi:hypothetical protein